MAQGANPVWESNALPDGLQLTDLDRRNVGNYNHHMDGNESDGSGGSIFIGVEDDDDFKGYKEWQEVWITFAERKGLLWYIRSKVLGFNKSTFSSSYIN